MELPFASSLSIHSCMEKPQRLAQRDWLDAALTALASGGHETLRAELLSKRLGVSRGSFYWHFADVAAFHKAVLARWEAVAVDIPHAAATKAAAGGESPAIRTLITVAFKAPVALERAVHSWASVSGAAADAVARANRRRIALLTEMLALTDDDRTRSHARAIILYWIYLGRILTPELTNDDTVLAELLGYFAAR